MEFQKYLVGCVILAYGVLCLLAGHFEHLRRRTFIPTTGVCEGITTGRKIIRPCYKHIFHYQYNDIDMIGQTVRDYHKLELNSKHAILVNPMKPTEVLQRKDIDRITRNQKMGYICSGIGIAVLVISVLL